jgi:hypothetical protein
MVGGRGVGGVPIVDTSVGGAVGASVGEAVGIWVGAAVPSRHGHRRSCPGVSPTSAGRKKRQGSSRDVDACRGGEGELFIPNA